MAQLSPSEMAAVYGKMLEAVMHDSRKLPKGSSNRKNLEERQRNQNDETQRNQNDETEECSMVDQVAKDLGIHIVEDGKGEKGINPSFDFTNFMSAYVSTEPMFVKLDKYDALLC
ncbi:hypothetical protein MKW92_025214 [Papaver armeniacum]|nr:hypothetical protein MKW92_025214 [Papaver armeniacum]